MLLSDLVARRDLDLRVLHAGPGALERSVRWVYTTDLPDPGRYLGGGELVISGLVWRHTPDDSERFVAAVARSGAIALAAGEAVYGEVPDDVVEACRRHDLVLFGVPERVSFGALTEVVVGTLAAARGDRLAHTLGRQRQLLDAVAAGAGLDEITARVSAATGLGCRVLTASGHVLAGPVLPDPERDALVRTFLTAERLPATCGRHTLFPVGPGTQRVTGWFVAAERPGGPEPDSARPRGPKLSGGEPRGGPDDRGAARAPDGARLGVAPGEAAPGGVPDDAAAGAVSGDAAAGAVSGDTADSVAELAAVAALDRARRRDAAAVARPIAEDAISRIAAGEGDRAETRVRLRQAGVDPDGGLTVVMLRAEGFTDPPAVAHQVLVDALTGSPFAVGVHDGAAVALLGPSTTTIGSEGSSAGGPTGAGGASRAADRPGSLAAEGSSPGAVRGDGSPGEPSARTDGATDATNRTTGTLDDRSHGGTARETRSPGEPSARTDGATDATNRTTGTLGGRGHGGTARETRSPDERSAGAGPDAPRTDPAARLITSVGRLAPGVGGARRFVVGVGRPAGPGALSGAFGEALHANGIATTRPGPVAVARAGDITSHVALLAGIPDDARRAFAAQVLGPVLDNDSRTGGELLETLTVFLDESGSWSRTAERLHLHVNTVRYRIGRVQDLTGRDLSRFPDRVDLYLALRAR